MLKVKILYSSYLNNIFKNNNRIFLVLKPYNERVYMTEKRVKRKISAILSADAAGYSRLMGEDEVSTVKTLEAYRKVMSDLIEQFRGRVVDSPGDNLLSEFSSVVDAVQCAVEIHEVIRAKNEELPEDRRMLFRIGVNLGDVIEEGDRIYGDGVNIAARLEGLAEAGGICISGSAHEQIKNKLALGYEYIGEHTVKNIAEPLKVYRVPMGPKAAILKEGDEKRTKSKKWQWTALGATGAIIVIIGALAIWNFYLRGPSIEPASIEPEQVPVVSDVEEAPKTIAVLPFEDISPEKDQQYFVDGLSEEILNSLAQIQDLTVIAKTSSFSFKGTNKTIQEIANVLDVDHILEGSVRKAGNALRITAQLIKAVDGSHIWSKTYDRELKVKEIFAVQEDIATSVADELKVTLGIGRSLKQLGGTDNLEAYELYLAASGQYYTLEEDRGLESIDAALALDPEFANAWALKAKIHIQLSNFGPSNRADTELDAALIAAQKAIELEPNLPEGYFELGSYESARGNWIDAELNYREALPLRPEILQIDMAHMYAITGCFKKSREIYEELRRNDPLNQFVRIAYVVALGLLRDTQGVENENERCKALFGDEWEARSWGSAYHRLGTGDPVSRNEIEYSTPVFDEAKDYLDSPKEGLAKLHQLYSDENNLSEVDITNISILAAYFGDPEFAMDAMEKGMKISPRGLFKIWYPVMKQVRQLPRFKKLMREIGLVEYWKQFGWPDLCHPVGDDDFECN
jgi:adenylate cyclase